MPNRVRVDASDLKKVDRIAKEFSPELNRQLRRQLRAAGKVGATAAKTSIAQMPSKTDGETHFIVKKTGVGYSSLRALIAQAISVNVSTTRRPDVRIRVRKTQELQQIGAAGIAKAINKGKPWKHPVFAKKGSPRYDKKESWPSQRGFEFFDKPIEARREEMKALVKAALDEAVKVAAAKGKL